MGKFTVGEIVLVTFPFSNLKGQKIRPALVLAKAEFDNFILCQITSRPYTSKIAVKLEKKDFESGSLPVISYIRPDKIFTADKSIIIGSAGNLKKSVLNKMLRKVQNLFNIN